MNDFIANSYTFMNDFYVKSHTFMNDNVQLPTLYAYTCRTRGRIFVSKKHPLTLTIIDTTLTIVVVLQVPCIRFLPKARRKIPLSANKNRLTLSRQTVSHFLSHLQAAGRSTIYSVATYSSLCERSNEVIS